MRRFAVLFAVSGFLFALSQGAVAEDVRIAAWNIKFFFDNDTSDNHSELAHEMSAPSAAEWQWRLSAVTDAIAAIHPAIMAFEEIENAKVMNEVVQKLHDNGQEYHLSFVQGNDSVTEQDVAFLVADGIPFTSDRIEFTHHGEAQYKDLSKHQLLTAEIDGVPVSLLAIHLNTNANDRLRQARTLRGWVDDLGPDSNVLVLGDTNVNTSYANTTANSDIGRIRGLTTSTPTDDLTDLHEFLTPQKRKTWADQRELDRILVSKSLMADGGPIKFSSIDTRRDLVVRGSEVDHANWAKPQAERDLSDHFPLVATFQRATDSHAHPHATVAEHGANDHAAATPDSSSEITALRDEVNRLRRRVDELESRNKR
jgi:endonuclease/exonuclease/phosphatase family metal-dependent hydrolase